VQTIPSSAVANCSRADNVWYPTSVNVYCGHCGEKVSIALGNPQYYPSASTVTAFGPCPNCRQNVTVVTFEPGPGDDRSRMHDGTRVMYPSAKSPRQKIEGAEFLPPDVHATYSEAIDVFNAKAWRATTAVARVTLEGIIAHLKPVGPSNDLAEQETSVPISAGTKRQRENSPRHKYGWWNTCWNTPIRFQDWLNHLKNNSLGKAASGESERGGSMSNQSTESFFAQVSGYAAFLFGFVIFLGFCLHVFDYVMHEGQRSMYSRGHRFDDDNATGATANAVELLQRDAPTGIFQKLIAATLFLIAFHVACCHAILARGESRAAQATTRPLMTPIMSDHRAPPSPSVEKPSVLPTVTSAMVPPRKPS
jgi:hypothetical protein